MMTLREFFERYASLAIGDQPQDLAALYAPTFIVAGPQGSQAFTNDERFIGWLNEVATFNRDHGMRALTIVALDETPLSPRHALAVVTWGAQFKKTGERLLTFEIAYLLELEGQARRILSYISKADQDDEMRKAGLLDGSA